MAELLGKAKRNADRDQEKQATTTMQRRSCCFLHANTINRQAVGIIRVVLPNPAYTTVSSWSLANFGSRLSSFLTEKCKRAAVLRFRVLSLTYLEDLFIINDILGELSDTVGFLEVRNEIYQMFWNTILQ
jgi:hypothetical protein